MITIGKILKKGKDSSRPVKKQVSEWDESTVMQQIALDTLMSLFNKKERNLFLIIDDTQTLIRRLEKLLAA